MNTQNIIVDLFEIKSQPSLALKIQPFLRDEDYKEGVMAYFVYPRREPMKPIFLYKFEGPKEDAKRNFLDELGDFINLYNPSSVKDFIFFIDFFCPVRPEPTILDLDKDRFTRNKFVDDILSDTHGYLLYDYQLHILLSFFYSNREKIILMQDGLNNRDSVYEEQAKGLRLDHGLTLYDVFTERVINFTVSPNVKGGRYLYEALQKE